MDTEQAVAIGRVLLESQYTALRAEITQRIQLQHNIMAVTLTFAAAFLGFAFEFPDIRAVLLLYPLLILFLAASWVHNDNRVHAIGYFIREHIERAFLTRFVASDKDVDVSNLQPVEAISLPNSDPNKITTSNLGTLGWENFFCPYKEAKGLLFSHIVYIVRRYRKRVPKEDELLFFSDRFLTDWYAKPFFLVTQLLALYLAASSIPQFFELYCSYFIGDCILIVLTFLIVIYPRTTPSRDSGDPSTTPSGNSVTR
ncbi:MAG: hypothetical protein M3437_10080 [Chloroflexota bacterium]|nr:hypothetical protein [Chloroflexota bacterium]MDQ5865438.1 hypothetical protein [Chloroflexota bacterium]